MKGAEKAGAGSRREALRFMWWLVVPVLALLVVLTLQQYWQGMADAERGLLRRAEERAQELEAIARPAAAHVHDLRRLLETHWHAPPSSTLGIRQWMRALPSYPAGAGAQTSPRDGWTLDDAPPDFRRSLGQIWWAPADGTPPNKAWLDRAALFLATARVAHERAPGFQGSYFVAGEANISWAYPWVSTPTMLAAMGVPSLQGLERLRLAGVERGQQYVADNPQDLTYWGTPYVGQLDGALVQSHGSIVLVDGRYAGEVSVDFQIESLQQLAVQWQDRRGARVWVVDRQALIVADSAEPLTVPVVGRTANQQIEIKLENRLPPALAPLTPSVVPAPPNGRLVRADGLLLLAAARTESPWVYVLSIPQSTLRAEVLPSLLPNALLGLALLLGFGVGQWLFARWFVTPALVMLQYVRELSADPSTPQPTLGRRWQGWIRAINQVFERQRLAQQQVELQRETLRHNEKLSAMGTLLAGVAHELNNPLAIVMGRASLMEERLRATVGQRAPVEVAAIGEDSRLIREAADRCGRIVRTFLNMARQRPATRNAVQMGDVVSLSLDMMGYTLRSRGIRVELGLATDLPAVQADADQLGQVLLNLVVNAQQAMESRPGERVLSISSGYSPEPIRTWLDSTVPHVWLQVSDNGPGIPEDLRERLFEPFFTTKEPGLGTGLGLSISRNVAREHGGDLVFLPSPGGASFRLLLPVTQASASKSQPTRLGEDAGDIDEVRRVLVVDDEPELVDIMRSILETNGYEVASAESGAVAVELLDAARFDAVICDMRMPDIDGRALWTALREHKPLLSRRMLFVTGDTLSPAARAVLVETGCASLDKPFEGSELLTAVRALLRR